ncbi:MAG: aminomethyl transferase family protein [Armatimonadota bacterium]|nr:aminomethyl transferase family protein [Armatimonadota bacterium]MDR7438583.1 aminomethyl transferase family protein [Armatimonadota bacterium]MDR7562696.1 aminomethyl transferase family protein [Armatimonadota bacterium]MDR7568606.1 aminomethyl transferase family protein [Armatimonadota bacterium]MDR7602865.1 aminomethyl transferase family protein [Armatimonadota bacterium]
MAEPQKPRNLQELIDSVPNLVDYLFRNPKGALFRFISYAMPSPYVSPEFTNWRDEQRSWWESVGLSDQSFHMTNLWIRGRDAFRLLERLAVNSFRGYAPGRAKQFIACSPDGYFVGDAVLYYLAPETFVLVGVDTTMNWVQYHAEAGGYDVRIERDPLFSDNPTGRRTLYRFELEGPNATPLMEKLVGGPLPEIKFFHFTDLPIAGCRVWVLRHSMTGSPGFELSGPWEDRERVLQAILEAGKGFGLRRIGSLAYFTNALESGWIAGPLPAIYTGEALRPYREWLPATSAEATGAIGGSFYSPNIEDYYLTPWDLGYGRIVRFDHDFIGREALEQLMGRPHRQKVTLVWKAEDVLQLVRKSLLEEGTPAKHLDLPVSMYARWKYDRVENARGERVGLSQWTGYVANERAVLSLAMVDPAYAEPGTEVVVVWGEDGGGARSGPWIERHEPVAVRATVAPVPISRVAREYWAAVKARR